MLKQIFLILAALCLALQIFKAIYQRYISLTRKERKILWIVVAALIIIGQFFG